MFIWASNTHGFVAGEVVKLIWSDKQTGVSLGSLRWSCSVVFSVLFVKGSSGINIQFMVCGILLLPLIKLCAMFVYRCSNLTCVDLLSMCQPSRTFAFFPQCFWFQSCLTETSQCPEVRKVWINCRFLSKSSSQVCLSCCQNDWWLSS